MTQAVSRPAGPEKDDDIGIIYDLALANLNDVY